MIHSGRALSSGVRRDRPPSGSRGDSNAQMADFFARSTVGLLSLSDLTGTGARVDEEGTGAGTEGDEGDVYATTSLEGVGKRGVKLAAARAEWRLVVSSVEVE